MTKSQLSTGVLILCDLILTLCLVLDSICAIQVSFLVFDGCSHICPPVLSTFQVLLPPTCLACSLASLPIPALIHIHGAGYKIPN
ncbi:hypothetical protein M432DRAFT_44317 [Thermoascus aurantiacus ATCC 26904]